MKNPTLIRVAGGTVAHGQFFSKPNNARDGGRAKITGTVSLAFGHKRRTTGKLSAFHHGITVQDEPMITKSAVTGKNVPVHEGMTNLGGLPNLTPRNLHHDDAAGSKHLQMAGQLGRPGHNHVGHAKFGTLLASRRKLSE